MISVRTMKCVVSVRVPTDESSTGAQKLGQPEPELYFVVDENSGAPQQTHA
mgnify:CR=1 FL=1